MISEPNPKPVLTREERRAKREARREKQRHDNISRAAKMHTARIACKPLPGTDRLWPTSKGEFNAHIGCSGWFYWHWRATFYPESLPTSKWFSHYSRRFKTVELNAPFYSWPTVSAVHEWIRQAGRRDFIYTVKACELITHVKRFAGTRTLVRDFGYIATLLGSRMGCFLFQLPPSFHYSPARLKRIAAQMDPSLRNVVEFRHRSWWNESVYAAFRSAGIIFCSCSGPKLPDELIKTTDEVYIRFHGTKQWYRHKYSEADLAVWVERIRASGATQAWVYFNNDREGHAITNARQLVRLLKTQA